MRKVQVKPFALLGTLGTGNSDRAMRSARWKACSCDTDPPFHRLPLCSVYLFLMLWLHFEDTSVLGQLVGVTYKASLNKLSKEIGTQITVVRVQVSWLYRLTHVASQQYVRVRECEVLGRYIGTSHSSCGYHYTTLTNIMLSDPLVHQATSMGVRARESQLSLYKNHVQLGHLWHWKSAIRSKC